MSCHASSRVYRALVGALVFTASGCAALFGLDDLPPLSSAGADASADDVASASSVTDASEANVDAPVEGGTDPRWALWPIPPDDPLSESFIVESSPNGRVITDPVTRLMWQDPQDEDSRPIDDARAYCDGLVHGGYDDWRMPTRIEAVSILHISPDAFALAPASFAGTKTSAECVWTGSVDLSGQTWSIYSGVGRKAIGPCWARCVRGGPPLGEHKPPVYVVEADTVFEPSTRLLWERTPPAEALTREAASARCAALSLKGQLARLPTIKELLSLVDEMREFPAHESAFSVLPFTLWSSTVSNGAGWLVELEKGNTVRLNESSNLTAASRCVVKL